ncbi:uncharacterized protein LOC108676567 [Hyalella azteca]|uniref:Uncharacterized protein LOC108669772 n=1 Tax=Hyalella azteca TaxID=294128 RepID=A0A8B7NGB7_HYAAZ|nr:uncharacterized protein LOC108669772 [Hyalella azteca]XP_018012671.1 uncharacterized protein LOC108669772 [Hyalella azteca]XP_018020144.1 uncharacterized protein LOC108676567 [Hyalella azteca]XP_018020145.1 uncharacterized protein LOC108676567 [Hyalella azteca]
MSLFTELCSITHCQHLDEFEQARESGRFLPVDASKSLPKIGFSGKVIWFAPSMDKRSHNKYGNVSSTITMAKFCEKFGKIFYEADTVDRPDGRVARLLCTRGRECLPSMQPVDVVHDEKKTTSVPLKQSGIYWVYRSKLDDVSMGLEIAVFVREDDCQWLFENSAHEANNHSLANTKPLGCTSKFCQKYNFYGEKCPSALTLEVAKMKMDER